jgi:prophage regulatory protein
MTTEKQLLSLSLLRIYQIVGDNRKGIPPLIPIGRTTFLSRVKAGVYPAPIKISERTVAWRSEDIRKLIKELGGEA